MVDRYTDGSKEIGYFFRSLNLITGGAGSLSDVLYKTLKLYKDDPVNKAIADSLKHDDAAMFEVDNFDEAKALRQKLNENGLVFSTTAAYKDKVYVVIPRSELERACDIVNDFYDSRSSGVFTADYINSYADSNVKEIKGLSENETTLFILHCKEQQVPINVEGPSDGSYRIRFAEKDLDKMERIRLDVSASLEGPAGRLYAEHLEWRNEYDKAVMNTVISGKFPDGKTVQEGSAIVGTDGKRVEISKQYIRLIESGSVKRISRNTNADELKKNMDEVSRFVKGIDHPVFLNSKEYALQKNMDTHDREAFFADKERSGFLLPREIYKESLIKNASNDRSPDGSRFHKGDLIIDDKGNKIEIQQDKVTISGNGSTSVSFERKSPQAGEAVREKIESMHNPVYISASEAKELNTSNYNESIRQAEIREREFVPGRPTLSKEDISLLAKAEAMRHTIDVRLQHDGIELPKTDRMTYHDAAQVFGLTSAETEDFSAALQQDVVSEVDENEISDVIDQIESNFGKTDPSDTVIPVSKEIMIDSIFDAQDQDADISPDFGNDFSQSEFDLEEF